MALSVSLCMCVFATFVHTGRILANIKKMMLIIDLDICHQMAQLQMLYFVTLTHFSKSNISTAIILETVRGNAKM